jgi:hypothetical protein
MIAQKHLHEEFKPLLRDLTTDDRLSPELRRRCDVYVRSSSQDIDR